MLFRSDPAITTDVEALGDGSYEVTLTAARPALWVWLSLSEADARYSDSFVNLLPGSPARIIVRPTTRLSLEAFRSQLQVRSLIDTYA